MEWLPVLRLTASPWLDAALVMAASLVAAKATDLFVTRVLFRFVSTTKSDFDDRVVSLLHRPIFLTVLLVGVVFSLRSLDVAGPVYLLPQTLIVVIWAITLLRISGAVFERYPRAVAGDPSASQHFGTLMKNITAVLLLILGVMAVLSVWKVSITPLLASAGIAGAAVAFAAKDTIANFLGGISVLMDRPYTIGHYIVLESGERGEVVDIGLRSTRVKTRDDILITVPNSVMANSKIINESAPIKRFRVRIPIGVAYGSDLEGVERILLDVAASNPGVEVDPEPRVRLRAFADSSVNFELLCWADDPVNRGRVIHELNKEIYTRFNREGVTIPFPQRDVHIHTAPSEAPPADSA